MQVFPNELNSTTHEGFAEERKWKTMMSKSGLMTVYEIFRVMMMGMIGGRV